MLESPSACLRFVMHHLRPSFIAVACAWLLGSSQALALGFGAAPGSATLGQALDFVVPLRLDGSEGPPPECVSAEVTVGEQRLQPANVRASLQGSGGALAVRVQTASSVDEPVLSVTVSVGCPTRLQRRFTLFADPPSGPSVLPPSAVVEVPAAAPAATATNDSRAPTPEPRAVAPAPQAAAAVPSRPRVPKPPSRVTARRTAPPAPMAAVAPRPRLKLDAVEPPAPMASAPAPLAAELIEAAASAAAARAAAAAASEAAGRIAALEKAIEKMRGDSAADRDALRQLRARAADADSAAGWLPYLAALVAALAGLSVWQWLKLRRLQRERQQAWWNAAAAAPPPGEEGAAASSVVPSSAPTPLAPLSGGNYTTTRPGALGTVFTPEPVSELPADGVAPAMERTQPLPVGWREEPETPRDVSIEELIDLEQQAEFFLVLGQEDAAIDLLVDHLRSTGGGSPMPYLKLLEIYRRRGDREAYERMRARFNHRFNAYAPDWDADPHEGRSLEDYPSIIARLQMAWPSPLDAMAELEALLFRKTKGELFDMPAYRDVLFLYSLARDLLDREPVETGNVDVLLPINDGETYTQPMSLEQIYDGIDSGSVPLDNAPTVPVDLDVTQPVIPDSLFSDPTEPGIGGGRRRH